MFANQPIEDERETERERKQLHPFKKK